MSTKSLISVITPFFNAEKTLRQTIESVLNQLDVNFEYILINDCSTDDGVSIVEEYLLDPKVVLINNENNIGVAASRNRGLELAKGEYVCFLDADDWWEPKKLAVQLEFMINEGCNLSYMDYNRISYDGAYLNTVVPPPFAEYHHLLRANCIGNLTAMVKRSSIGEIRFKKVGHEDYLFWLNILASSAGLAKKCIYQCVLCNYRVGANSLSSNKLRALVWQWRLYRDSLKLSMPVSILYMLSYGFSAIRKRG